MLAKNIIAAFVLAAVGMATPVEKRWGSGGGSRGGDTSTNCVCSTGQEPTWCSDATGILGLGVLDELCGRSPLKTFPRSFAAYQSQVSIRMFKSAATASTFSAPATVEAVPNGKYVVVPLLYSSLICF
jgi:hypothetical protein